MVRRASLVLALTVLAAAPAARAQGAPLPPAWPIDQAVSFPVTAAQGRDIAWRFLTEGDVAPRPDLKRAAIDGARVDVGSEMCPRFTGLLLRVTLGDGTRLTISPAGRVVEYRSSAARTCVVQTPGRTEADVAGEADARCRPIDELRPAALAFLRARYRDFDRRTFREVRAFVRQASSPFEALFVLREEARPDQRCIYMNVVLVYVNPETREVVGYLGEDVDAPVVTDAPPVTEPRAREVAREAAGSDVAGIALGYFMKGLTPTLTWRLVTTSGVALSIDARTAEVYADEDEGR